jgi:RyR domain/TrkA-N domain
MKIRDLEWWIVGIIGIASFILAIVGFNELFIAAGIERNFLDLMFQSMKIFGMEFVDEFQSPLPWQLEVSRWLAPGVLLYTAAKAIIYFIKREFKSLTIKFYKNHVIVTSLNEKSRFLVNDLLKNGRKVIVIAGIENSRKLDLLEKDGAVIIEGDFANENFLKTISAHKAKYFVFVDDDETNISNAILTYQYLNKYGSPDMHSLFTHVSDDVKLKEFVELKFFEELMKQTPADSNCEIRIFSINERSSRTIFHKYPPDMDKIISSREDDQIHTAVIGSGDLALSMIVRLARTGHFANLKKIKVSWFHEGKEIFEKLKHSYPQIDKIIELHSYEGPLHLFNIAKFEELNKSLEFSSVYFVCKDDSLSTKILTLISNIDVKNPLKVILTLMNPVGILNRWYNAKELRNIDLYKFNLIEEVFTEDSIISEKNDKLAKLVHEFYLPPKEKRNPNKSSHVEWGKLPFDFKIQNRAQADHIFVKTRAMNFDVFSTVEEEKVITIDDKSELFELLAETEHNRWMAQLYLNGWRYSEVRDDSKKLHTDLKPYNDLSEGVKDWDRDAVRNIPKLIKLYEGENA